MLKKLTVLLFVLLAIYSYFKFFKKAPAPTPIGPLVPADQIYQGISYEPVNPDHFEILPLADHLISPTRIKITPDGKYLFVTQITGEVIAFKRVGTNDWTRQSDPVVKIDTHFPGFPPDEAGLTAITLSADFNSTHKAFLFYTFKDQDGKTKNRASGITIKEVFGKLSATTPQLIFDANVDGSASHQIQEAVSIKIQGVPHLLFPVGEGFKSERAQDENLEAGKLILIQEDGTAPLGQRPFANPKVQALGIRNAFVIAQNPSDPSGKVMLADTGPDRFDRLIYANLYSAQGESIPKFNFGWNGQEESLIKNVTIDGQTPIHSPVIFSLPETRTFTGIIFHPGDTRGIPKSDANVQTVLATMFGKTGVPDPSPGKEIWLGRLSLLSPQPTIKFEPIIHRVKAAEGKLGNPIGLELDPKTGDFFFADILEGRLYQVKPL